MKLFFASIWKLLGLPKNIQLGIMRVLHDQFLIGVAGVIFNENNEILLFKHTYRKRSWSLPGGYLKGKEHPREGLEREIKEESGFVVSIDQRLKERTDRESARLELCYMGEFIGGKFKKSHEVSSAKFYSFDKLPLLPKNQLFLISQALGQRKKSERKRAYVKKKRKKMGIVSRFFIRFGL